jgi:ATP-dependent helicase HrpB
MPEMLSADLAELVLQLARWGATDPGKLRWLDAPPTAAWNQARELLQELTAVDAEGRITNHGRELLALPLHPRLGHMLLRGKTLAWGALACDVAALLSERDPLYRAGTETHADLHARLQLLKSGNPDSQRRTRGLREVAAQLRRSLGLRGEDAQAGDEGVLVALAYPDRIAQRRAGGAPRYLLANGRGALLAEGDPLGKAEWLSVAQVGSEVREAKIFLAAALRQADVHKHFPDLIVESEFVVWDDAAGAVQARKQKRLGALVLEDAPAQNAPPHAITEALLAGIRQRGLDCLPWTPALRNLQARLLFLRRVLGLEWPDVSDAALFTDLETWLAPYLTGMSRISHLQRLQLDEALLTSLDYRQRRSLDEFAPLHIPVPSGSNIRVDYTEGDIPVLRVRLQELFGMRDTPRLAGGKLPVMLHLLSPGQRPVQVTQDLAGFWQRTWLEVRKELKGRYPKHNWPDDPTTAQASRGARRRR